MALLWDWRVFETFSPLMGPMWPLSESASVDVSLTCRFSFRAITDERVQDVDDETDFAYDHGCHWPRYCRRSVRLSLKEMLARFL